MSCMMVSRKETTCRTFSGDSQLSLDKSSFCMDPLHDLLWRCALLFSSFKSSSHSNCFFLHSFAPSESLITAHSALKVDMRDVKELTPHLRDLAFTEPLLPVYPGSSTTRAHLALHMLGTSCQASTLTFMNDPLYFVACLDTLTTAHGLNMIVQQDECEKQTSSKVYAKEDFSVVNRFESEFIKRKKYRYFHKIFVLGL